MLFVVTSRTGSRIPSRIGSELPSKRNSLLSIRGRDSYESSMSHLNREKRFDFSHDFDSHSQALSISPVVGAAMTKSV